MISGPHPKRWQHASTMTIGFLLAAKRRVISVTTCSRMSELDCEGERSGAGGGAECGLGYEVGAMRL